MKKRDKFIQIKVTKEEKEKLRKLAEEKNLDMSNYIRIKLLK